MISIEKAKVSTPENPSIIESDTVKTTSFRADET